MAVNIKIIFFQNGSKMRDERKVKICFSEFLKNGSKMNDRKVEKNIFLHICVLTNIFDNLFSAF